MMMLLGNLKASLDTFVVFRKFLLVISANIVKKFLIYYLY